MKLIDNHIEKLGDDLKNEITESSKIRILKVVIRL